MARVQDPETRQCFFRSTFFHFHCQLKLWNSPRKCEGFMYSIQVNDLSKSVISMNEHEVVLKYLILKLRYPKVPFYGPCAGLKNASHLNSTLKCFLIINCCCCNLAWCINAGFLSTVQWPLRLKCAVAHVSVEEGRIILGTVGGYKIKIESVSF